MVVVEFLVADRQAKLADSRSDHARSNIQIVFVAAPAVEVAQPKASQLGAVRRYALSGVIGEPSRKHLVAQLARTTVEGQIQIEEAVAAWRVSGRVGKHLHCRIFGTAAFVLALEAL